MQQKIKTLQIIHLTITFGVIVIYFILGNKKYLSFNLEFNDSYYPYLAIPFAAIIFSGIVYKFVLKTAQKLNDEGDKFTVYQSACIARWAIVEAGAFILLFLKSELLIFGAILILYLFFLKPTEERFKNDIG